MPAPKILKQVSGTITEEATVAASAGAGSADKVVALNAGGLIDNTMLPLVLASTGAPDVNKIPKLDAAGRLDSTVLPVGIGADTASIVASEALSAGHLINVWDDAGTPKMRKADGSAAGKEAMGFVLAAVGSGATGVAYFEGSVTGLSGLVGGKRFLSVTTPGGTQASAPTGSGQVIQQVGFATSATVMNFNAGPHITLA